MIDREIVRGLLKICVLACAAQEEIYGLGLIERLGRIGFRVSPGTLYPCRKKLLAERDLRREVKRVGGKRRLMYRLSRKGRRELEEAKEKMGALQRAFGLLEEAE